jgi:hypothetical protein
MRDRPAVYQVAVHRDNARTFHPESTLIGALRYAVRQCPGAQYVAIERWSDVANMCAGGWVVADVLRDVDNYADGALRTAA